MLYMYYILHSVILYGGKNTIKPNVFQKHNLVQLWKWHNNEVYTNIIGIGLLHMNKKNTHKKPVYLRSKHNKEEIHIAYHQTRVCVPQPPESRSVHSSGNSASVPWSTLPLTMSSSHWRV